jgi:hypothetical protein
MGPKVRQTCGLALAVLLAPGASPLAAEGAQGSAQALRVTVQAGGANALDTGALPAGAAASAPTDYAIVTDALDTKLTLSTLATVVWGPRRWGVRARLGRQLS